MGEKAKNIFIHQDAASTEPSPISSNIPERSKPQEMGDDLADLHTGDLHTNMGEKTSTFIQKDVTSTEQSPIWGGRAISQKSQNHKKSEMICLICMVVTTVIALMLSLMRLCNQERIKIL